jgi:hypothetical protein
MIQLDATHVYGVSQGTLFRTSRTAGRREDLRRSGSRPYEGREAEAKEAARIRANDAQAYDRRLEQTVVAAWNNLSPEKKRAALRAQ